MRYSSNKFNFGLVEVPHNQIPQSQLFVFVSLLLEGVTVLEFTTKVTIKNCGGCHKTGFVPLKGLIRRVTLDPTTVLVTRPLTPFCPTVLPLHRIPEAYHLSHYFPLQSSKCCGAKGPRCIRLPLLAALRRSKRCHHLSRVSSLHRPHQKDGPVL